MNMSQFIQYRRTTPQYNKSIDILMAFSKIENYMNIKINRNNIDKALRFKSGTIKNILAGNPRISIDKYDSVLNYLSSKYLNKRKPILSNSRNLNKFKRALR